MNNNKNNNYCMAIYQQKPSAIKHLSLPRYSKTASFFQLVESEEWYLAWRQISYIAKNIKVD